ncbi:MAG: pilin [Patescibacteria group bacterium]
MKILFIFTAIFVVLIFPISSLAQEVECTCSGTVELSEAACNQTQTVGCVWSGTDCVCELKGNVPVGSCSEAEILDLLGMESLAGGANLTCTATPPAPTTAAPAVEQAVGLGEAQSAVDRFLGNPEIKGQLIQSSMPTLVGNILKVFLGVIGSLALVLFIYGGVLWLTSGGSEDKLKKARGTMIWAVLGLVVIFSSYAIVSAVISGITNRSQVIQDQQQQTSACLADCQNKYDEKIQLDCKNLPLAESAGYKSVAECETAAQSRLRSCRALCREAFQ